MNSHTLDVLSLVEHIFKISISLGSKAIFIEQQIFNAPT